MTVQNLNFLDNNLPDKCANLIIADPPYFEVKGSFDFIWKSFDDYLIDVEKWAIECKRILSDNGTLFWWGHAKKIAYTQVVLDKYFNLENSLVWEKKDCQTRIGVDSFSCFAPITERLLMYSLDDNNLTYTRDYIRLEIVKSKGKISFKDINSALGVATNGGGVASACLSTEKKDSTMITEDLYLKLQEYCYPYLTKEYKELKRTFNNFQKLYDVLKFSQEVNITGKYDHDTKKPETLTRTLILTCSRKDDLVVVPFAGSGTECAMAIKEGRKAAGFDIEKKYVDMANRRCEAILLKPELF